MGPSSTRVRTSTILRSKAFRRILFRVVATVILVPLFLQLLVAYVLSSDPRILPRALQDARNILIVTAHPDDEALFFAPAILGALETGRKKQVGEHVKEGGLLVLSAGNNSGAGETRKKELVGSCKALGILKNRCVVIDRAELQDNPHEWWSEDIIIEVVQKYTKAWDIDAIVTFDDYGVSGHINHRAVGVAIRNYARTQEHAPVTYTLTSVALARKYTFLGDLPLTCAKFFWRIVLSLTTRASSKESTYNDKALMASTWHTYSLTRKAFASHESQYSWDRHLYLVLSRYAWFNDLQRVERDRQPAVGA